MRKHSFEISELVCTQCNNKFPIPRRCSSRREKNHIKTIWCPYCKQDRNMNEIRSIDFI